MWDCGWYMYLFIAFRRRGFGFGPRGKRRAADGGDFVVVFKVFLENFHGMFVAVLRSYDQISSDEIMK